MKFRYLGTAAAEGWPAMFCSCESCKKAVEAGGRNIRTRSQAVIDDRLLIDFPADTYMHILHNGLDLTKIKSCIITHGHSDHLYPADFEMRRQGFAYFETEFPFTVYGTRPTCEKAQHIIGLYHLDEQNRVLYKEITPFETFQVDEYTVTPLKADHDASCDPVLYIIGDGEKTILYAHDTGYFPEETWRCLQDRKPRFDFVSIDCTLGVQECSRTHMGLSTVIGVRERLLKTGCTDRDTVYCLNHFSHNGKAVYDELLPIAQRHGFLVSYDGMTIEI